MLSLSAINAMKINEIVKIKHGNGGKVTRQYVPDDQLPDLANPIAKQVLTQPHLRQRIMKTNKKVYDRKKIKAE